MCIEKARKDQEEVGEMIANIDDVTDTWQDAMNEIQKKIIEKAIEFGLTQEELDDYSDEELLKMYKNEEGIFSMKNFEMKFKDGIRKP